MKNLHPVPENLKETPTSTTYTHILNKEHFIKYLLLLIVVTLATLVIPTCGVLKEQAVFVGLVAATTFAVIDIIYPNNVYINEFHNHSN